MPARARFLRSLWSEGRVRVAPVAASAGGPLLPEPARGELIRVVEECAREDRRECPFEPPTVDLECAVWAAEMLFRACSAVVHRDLSSEHLAALLDVPSPRPADTPQASYSVDLTFRFLFDVARIARAASAADPLLPFLTRWGESWPLSSVGIPGLGRVDVRPFWGDRCLRAIYVDRIIERQDHSRMEDERVQTAVKEALGIYLELAPQLSASLTA